MFFKSVIAASIVATASAHQNFHQFWVNDISPGFEAAIRMPPSNSPVTDVTSNDITCNVNGNTVPSGKGTALANAGDTIKVQWDSSSHPGPIQHFLFGPVANASEATGVGSWVKIDEFIQENGTWANEVMMANDMTYSFKLPTDLQSGDYLLRSEMLALHGAQSLGGAQWYMGCAQLTITGSSTASVCGPSIELPGAYKEDDPSIYIPNVYNGFDISTYTGPGGAVATCGVGSGSGSTTATSVAASATAVAVSSGSAAVSTSAAIPTAKASVSSAVESVDSPVATTAFASSAAISAVPTTLITRTSAVAPVSTSSVAEDDEDC